MIFSPDNSRKRNPFDIYSLSALRRRRKDPAYARYPSFNQRMIAATLDSLVLMFLAPVFEWLAPIDRASLHIESPPEGHPAPLSYIAAQFLANTSFIHSWMDNFMLQFVVFLLFSGLCWHFWAATPGKLIMQMKVVDAQTGNNISSLQIFFRLCGYVISISSLMLGVFWIGMNKKKRGWHDYLAGTVVVREPWQWRKLLGKSNPPPEVKDETAAD